MGFRYKKEVLDTLNEIESGLARIEQILQLVIKGEKKIMATEQDVLNALDKIDQATTNIAGNIGTMAPVLATVSDEMDVLIAAAKAAGVPQDILDRATNASNNAQTVSDNLAALVPALQAIATKGSTEPVPVPVPTPAPTT